MCPVSSVTYVTDLRKIRFKRRTLETTAAELKSLRPIQCHHVRRMRVLQTLHTIRSAGNHALFGDV